MYDRRAIFKAAWNDFRSIRARADYAQLVTQGTNVSFAMCLKHAWKMAKAEAKRNANPNRERIAVLERRLNELDYLPAHMHTTRRLRRAEINNELAALAA